MHAAASHGQPLAFSVLGPAAPPFWAPRASRVTAEEVECYKTMDLPAFHQRWRALVAEARAAIARFDALDAQAGSAATGDAAARRADARSTVWDVGVRLSRTHHLLVRSGAVLAVLWAGLRLRRPLAPPHAG
jgi:hypothetical protein